MKIKLRIVQVCLYLILPSCLLIAQNPVVSEPVRFLALGDSYTVGTSVKKEDSWPYQLKSQLEQEAWTFDTIAIIARSGWTTGILKNEIEKAEPLENFNLVSLLIGVNNQYVGLSLINYETEFKELLEKAIEITGSKNRVFVISIPDYGYTPFGESRQPDISAEIDKFNAINRKISRQKQVTYFYITDLTRMGLDNPEYVASDGLHPSASMYSLWVDIIMDAITETPTSAAYQNDISQNSKKYITLVKNERLYFLSEQAEQLQGCSVNIYSLTGRLLISDYYFSGVAINQLKTGLYIYTIQNKNNIFHTGKFFFREESR